MEQKGYKQILTFTTATNTPTQSAHMQIHAEVIINIKKYWFQTSVFSLIMLHKSLEAMICCMQ